MPAYKPSNDLFDRLDRQEEAPEIELLRTMQAHRELAERAEWLAKALQGKVFWEESLDLCAGSSTDDDIFYGLRPKGSLKGKGWIDIMVKVERPHPIGDNYPPLVEEEIAGRVVKQATFRTDGIDVSDPRYVEMTGIGLVDGDEAGAEEEVDVPPPASYELDMFSDTLDVIERGARAKGLL